ncbi:uncharacterized protein EI97DRAFT_389447 [Westerdykella ornata]|uniref:Uncharacterized protein n=1 Tax=Westerdykella ornata TaxID=318751 RepID=A0A6A6JY28_WESOR|nr:uncharacterized protein EI97DRAFT_389447 [Westerdykella ornata]KAF2281105.1 hypothetical protein EI97DRAFT_389447 [Westerdykella ornata]
MVTQDFAAKALEGVSKLVKHTAAPPRRARAASANCSHIDMDRLYTREKVCCLCQRPPSMGFLYVCRADRECRRFAATQALLDTDPDDERKSMSPLRRELAEAGLSESVIRQAEQGVYTAAQLGILKKQKLVLKQTIQDTYQAEHALSVAARLEAEAEAKAEAGPSQVLGVGRPPFPPSKVDDPVNPPCKVRVCPACRPYFQDRVWASIGRIAGEELQPLRTCEAKKLPVKDARPLRTIGLRPNPLPAPSADPLPTTDENTPTTFSTSADLSSISSSAFGESEEASMVTFKTTQTDVSFLDRMRDPRRRFYALTHRSSTSIALKLTSRPLQGMRETLKSIFKPKDRETKMERSHFPSSSGFSSTVDKSSITLPLPRSGTARSMARGLVEGERVREMDLGPLRRVRRQKERIEFETGVVRGGFEIGPRLRVEVPKGRSVELEDADEREDSTPAVRLAGSLRLGGGGEESDAGSEVSVEGGVALTEEAVETQTPDVVDVLVDVYGDERTAANGREAASEGGEWAGEGEDAGEDEVGFELDEEETVAWTRAENVIAQL